MKSRGSLPIFLLLLIILTLISCKIIAFFLPFFPTEPKGYIPYEQLTEEEKRHWNSIRQRYPAESIQLIYERFLKDPVREGAWDRAENNRFDYRMGVEAHYIVKAFGSVISDLPGSLIDNKLVDAIHLWVAGRTGDRWRISALDVGVGIFDIGWNIIAGPAKLLEVAESDTPIRDVVQALLFPIVVLLLNLGNLKKWIQDKSRSQNNSLSN